MAKQDLFWAKVRKTQTCWIWLGCKNNKGYGQVRRNNVTLLAHRYSYILTGRKLRSGTKLLHVCDVPLCVNPNHLRIGTQADNVKDAVNKGRHIYGERMGRSKLTTSEVRRIMKDSRKQKEIAKDYNVHQSVISRIKTGSRGTWRKALKECA